MKKVETSALSSFSDFLHKLSNKAGKERSDPSQPEETTLEISDVSTTDTSSREISTPDCTFLPEAPFHPNILIQISNPGPESATSSQASYLPYLSQASPPERSQPTSTISGGIFGNSMQAMPQQTITTNWMSQVPSYSTPSRYQLRARPSDPTSHPPSHSPSPPHSQRRPHHHPSHSPSHPHSQRRPPRKYHHLPYPDDYPVPALPDRFMPPITDSYYPTELPSQRILTKDDYKAVLPPQYQRCKAVLPPLAQPPIDFTPLVPPPRLAPHDTPDPSQKEKTARPIKRKRRRRIPQPLPDDPLVNILASSQHFPDTSQREFPERLVAPPPIDPRIARLPLTKMGKYLSLVCMPLSTALTSLFTFVNVPPDGNCFFHSLMLFTQRKNPQKSALRKAILKYTFLHYWAFRFFTKMNTFDIKSQLTNMLQPSYGATPLVVYATSLALRQSICELQWCPISSTQHGVKMSLFNCQDDRVDYVVFLAHNHYCRLVPKEPFRISSSSSSTPSSSTSSSSTPSSTPSPSSSYSNFPPPISYARATPMSITWILWALKENNYKFLARGHELSGAQFDYTCYLTQPNLAKNNCVIVPNYVFFYFLWEYDPVSSG